MRRPITFYQNYDYGYSISDKSQFVGEITGVKNGMWEVEVRNHFELNDTIEILTPKKNYLITLDNLFDRKGNPIDTAKGDGHIVYFKCPLEDNLAPMAILVRRFKDGLNTRASK